LAEGQLFFTVHIGTMSPPMARAEAPDAIAIQVVDRSDGDGARGDYVGAWPGVMRPKLAWSLGRHQAVDEDGQISLAEATSAVDSR
jgi:hypothetical protein